METQTPQATPEISLLEINLQIQVENSESFIDELEELCKKYALAQNYFFRFQ